MGAFRAVIVETFLQHGDPASANLKARPLAGQGFSTSMRVECSRSMRNRYPRGTILLLQARPEKRDGRLILYASSMAAYSVLTPQEAVQLVRPREFHQAGWLLIV